MVSEIETRHPVGSRVEFRVPRGRVGGYVEGVGTVLHHRTTQRGAFVEVQSENGRAVSVRPGCIYVAA